jgi:hypothetical protein
MNPRPHSASASQVSKHWPGVRMYDRGSLATRPLIQQCPITPPRSHVLLRPWAKQSNNHRLPVRTNTTTTAACDRKMDAVQTPLLYTYPAPRRAGAPPHAHAHRTLGTIPLTRSRHTGRGGPPSRQPPTSPHAHRTPAPTKAHRPIRHRLPAGRRHSTSQLAQRPYAHARMPPLCSTTSDHRFEARQQETQWPECRDASVQNLGCIHRCGGARRGASPWSLSPSCSQPMLQIVRRRISSHAVAACHILQWAGGLTHGPPVQPASRQCWIPPRVEQYFMG